MHLPTANQLRVAGVALFVLGFVTAQDIQDAGAQGAAKPATPAGGKQAPIFEVDPFWPKPLPNHWVTGSTIGLSVDDQDNVWTIHRPNTVDANFKAADLKASEAVDDEVQPGAPGRVSGSDPIGACCKVAPPILVYDAAGNVVSHWGGPGAGYEWPDSNHGVTVDHKGNVWMAGNGGKDTQVLKFTKAREVPAAARQARRAQRQQRHAELLAADEDLPRAGGERGLHLGRLRQPARHRLRRRDRRLQAALGRVRQQAGRCEDAAVQPVGAAVEAVQHRALRHRLGRRLRLRLRSGERSHPGVPQGRHASSRKRSSTRTPTGRARCGI